MLYCWRTYCTLKNNSATNPCEAQRQRLRRKHSSPSPKQQILRTKSLFEAFGLQTHPRSMTAAKHLKPWQLIMAFLHCCELQRKSYYLNLLPNQSKLDPDYPKGNQFQVSKGCVSGSVLGAAVAVRCSCCGVRARCRWCGVYVVWCKCYAVRGGCRRRGLLVLCNC